VCGYIVAGLGRWWRVESSVEPLTPHDAARQWSPTPYEMSLFFVTTLSEGGVRPFGLSTLITGFSPEGTPQLFHTDPSGTYSEWKANATGRNSKAVREWLEKQYAETAGDETIKLALKAGWSGSHYRGCRCPL